MPEDIIGYMSSLVEKLGTRDFIPRSTEHLAAYPLTTEQCIYIINYRSKEITFQKGVFELLGYSPDEFNFERALDNFHSNDREIVIRLIKGTLMYATENNVSHDVAFCVTFRIKHKDGRYIKVLRQSNVFDLDANGAIISNISMLTNISYIQTTDRVEWKFSAPGLDQKKFAEYIRASHINFFSDREMEILQLLKQGYTSEQISNKLFISKHTVDTHRRKMLQKTNCENTVELLNFYDRHI